MKQLLAFGSLAVALFAVSCEKENNEENISAQDRNFVDQITLSNRAEISLGNLAFTKAANDSVRMYAGMMITEHTTAEAELKNIAGNLDIDLPADSLDATKAALRTTLMALSGRAFDSAYISSQVTGHQQALTIVQTQTTAGTNAQLRSYAGSLEPKVQMHLDLADTISARY